MTHDNYDAVVITPFGALGIVAQDALTSIDFLRRDSKPRRSRNPLVLEVCAQLQAYLSDPRHVFDLPLDLPGSAYQARVWRALRRIPAGRVLSYGKLADKLASGPRAVGNACRANPVLIVVPCHRVVGHAGLGGFMGGRAPAHLNLKRWLLAHERAA
jgi:methylated-DNA-[protein]-cysteine S-methyltransferase